MVYGHDPYIAKERLVSSHCVMRLVVLVNVKHKSGKKHLYTASPTFGEIKREKTNVCCPLQLFLLVAF